MNNKKVYIYKNKNMETIEQKVKKKSKDLYNDLECKTKYHIEETYEDFMNRYRGLKSKGYASMSLNINTYEKEDEMNHHMGEKIEDFMVRYNALKSEGHTTMTLNTNNKEEIMNNLRSIDNNMDTYVNMELMRRKEEEKTRIEEEKAKKEAIIKAKAQEKLDKIAKWASEVEKRMKKMKERKVVWR